MENNQPQAQTPQPNPVVTFPTAQTPKGGMPKWPFAAGGVLLILGIGGFFLMQSNKNNSEDTATPTPYVSGLSTIETPTPTDAPIQSSSPTPSATPVTDNLRSTLAIEIQNGTGTPGDAGLAKKQLDNLGYKKVTTGNASDTSATDTVITYTKDVPATIISEITNSLQSVFSSVTAQKGVLTGTTSIRIVTGKKSSGTTKASATPSPTGVPAH